MAGEAVSEETRNLAALCHKHIRKPPRSLITDQSGLVETLADWREEIDQQSGSVDFAIDTLSIATSLPWLAGKIASQFWWEILDGLWHVVGEMGNTEPTVERPPVESLTQQMLAAELPLTLAAVLPEIRPIHQMGGDRRPSRRSPPGWKNCSTATACPTAPTSGCCYRCWPAGRAAA